MGKTLAVFGIRLNLYAFIAIAGFICFVISWLVAKVVFEFSGAAVITNIKHPWAMLVGAVTIGPFIETLTIAILIFIASKLTVSIRILVPSVAIIMAALHSLVSIGWGFYVFLPFLIFVYSYCVWRRSFGSRYGFVASAAVHALHNFLAIVISISGF